MDNKATTLRDLFTELDTRLDKLDSAEGREFDESLRGELAGIEIVASRPALVAKVAELLDVKLPSVLMKFWATGDEIRQAMAESKEKPDDRIYLTLAEHEVKGTLYPAIEMRIGPAGLINPYEVRFTLELNCKLTGIQLQIAKGEITTIEAGFCEVQGTLLHGKLKLATAPRKGSKRISLGLKQELDTQSPEIPSPENN